MNLLNKIDNYLTDTEYKIIYKKNYLNIINYLEVIDFTDKEIKIRNKYGITKVKGINLVISKMLDNELLITGNIQNLEV